MADYEKWAKKITAAYEALEKVDYYTLLNVPKGADIETIRKAYYMRAQQLHPDRVKDMAEPFKSQAIAIFKRVVEAYQTLMDPQLRKIYNEAQKKGGDKRLIISDRLSLKPKGELDFLTTDNGKQYWKAAREALKRGNVPIAKLNLKLVIQYEGMKNEVRKLAREIDAAARGRK